jgi:quinol monooxygenase YgiN
MIVIAGTATIRPAYWDEAVQKAQQMIEATEAEPGCRSYRIYVDPIERNTAFLFEEWEHIQALTAHLQTPHFQEFNTYLAHVLTEPPHIFRYEVSAKDPLR